MSYLMPYKIHETNFWKELKEDLKAIDDLGLLMVVMMVAEEYKKRIAFSGLARFQEMQEILNE